MRCDSCSFLSIGDLLLVVVEVLAALDWVYLTRNEATLAPALMADHSNLAAVAPAAMRAGKPRDLRSSSLRSLGRHWLSYHMQQLPHQGYCISSILWTECHRQ